ncbi:MAG: hypothetical protein KGL35_11380, partial [Bradyrhizobium sp.]|nr:hypothetical protein [Bradyrhizobium sp.]
PGVSRAWKAIADHFKSAAAIILIALAGLLGGQDAHAAQGNPAVSEGSNSACAYIYYAKLRQLLRWLAQGLRTTFPALPGKRSRRAARFRFLDDQPIPDAV